MPPSQPASTRAFIIEIDELPPIRVFGLCPAERLQRTLRTAGVQAVAIASEPPSRVTRGGDRVLLFRADWIYDERLVCALVEAEDSLLVRPGGDGGPEPVAAHVDGDNGEAATLVEFDEGVEVTADFGCRDHSRCEPQPLDLRHLTWQKGQLHLSRLVDLTLELAGALGLYFDG